jgi:hypothetical protein
LLADCHSSLRNLYDYWNARRGSRPMPARGDLDPIDLKAVLPLLILIDVVGGRAALRLSPGRHAAKSRCAAAIRPARRSRKPSTRPESAEESTWYLDHVVRTREPVLLTAALFSTPPPAPRREDVLFLPLSGRQA